MSDAAPDKNAPDKTDPKTDWKKEVFRAHRIVTDKGLKGWFCGQIVNFYGQNFWLISIDGGGEEKVLFNPNCLRSVSYEPQMFGAE